MECLFLPVHLESNVNRQVDVKLCMREGESKLEGVKWKESETQGLSLSSSRERAKISDDAMVSKKRNRGGR